LEGDVIETRAAGILYVVSTPIGNMGDFSFRAVETLRSVTLILAEDTRHSRPLLQKHEIRTRLVAYHEHNEAKSVAGLIEQLKGGEDLALISDAGTPLLSDPGERLVRAATEAGIKVVPVPGASALLAALVASGLPTQRFAFHGFPPRKGRERGELLDEVASSRMTCVLYEGPARVAATLRELAERAPGRESVVARELTKQYEELRRGTLESLSTYYEQTPPRGEVVIMIAGATPTTPDEAELRQEAAALRARGLSVRDTVAELVKRGTPRNVAYRLARHAEMGNG
jgi:16S rRNA (cytidine1402-2'-O)-methyltransferase